MTPSSVSIQGFTHKNDMCDSLKLSHLKGAPQRITQIVGIFTDTVTLPSAFTSQSYRPEELDLLGS
jgi:hypothetical protein